MLPLTLVAGLEITDPKSSTPGAGHGRRGFRVELIHELRSQQELQVELFPIQREPQEELFPIQQELLVQLPNPTRASSRDSQSSSEFFLGHRVR